MLRKISTTRKRNNLLIKRIQVLEKTISVQCKQCKLWPRLFAISTAVTKTQTKHYFHYHHRYLYPTWLQRQLFYFCGIIIITNVPHLNDFHCLDFTLLLMLPWRCALQSEHKIHSGEIIPPCIILIILIRHLCFPFFQHSQNCRRTSLAFRVKFQRQEYPTGISRLTLSSFYSRCWKITRCWGHLEARWVERSISWDGCRDNAWFVFRSSSIETRDSSTCINSWAANHSFWPS